MATEILPQLNEDEDTLLLLERFADRMTGVTGTMAYRMAGNGVTRDDLGIGRRQFVRLRLCFVPRDGQLARDILTIADALGIDPDIVQKAAGL